MGRRALLAVALVATVALAAPPAGAHVGGGPANVVVAQNTIDAFELVRSRTRLASDQGSAVAAENLALASSSCTDCRTVAVAVQVVLVDGAATHFHPANAAVASNAGCTGCETLAYARQDVVRVDRALAVRASTVTQVQAFGDAIDAVAASGASLDDIPGQIDALVDQMVALLLDEAARAGVGAGRSADRRVRAA